MIAPTTSTAMSQATAVPQDTCASTQKVVTKQQRYQAKLKAARKRRKEDHQARIHRDRYLSFDGRRSGESVSGVPRLGALKLENYIF
jgi:hypothetical protein